MVRNPIPTCRISVSSTAEAVPKKMKDEIAIYPKVKVREEKDSDDHPAEFDQKRSYLLSLKDFEWLFLEDSSTSSGLLFTGKKHHVSPSSTAKIPKDYSPLVVKPSTSESQEAEKMCKKVEDDNKANIRASSIPMPRAVVSSPENDLMIGKKHRKTAEKPSVLKNHNSNQSRHEKCKIIPNHGDTESPINSRKLKEGVDRKGHYDGKNSTAYRGCSFKSKNTP